MIRGIFSALIIVSMLQHPAHGKDTKLLPTETTELAQPAQSNAPSGSGSPWLIAHYQIERTINLPVKDVWPIFRNIRAWMTDYRIEPIDWPSSDPITVGAKSRVIPLYGKALTDPNMYYVIDVYEVIPEKEILIWLGSDNPGLFDLSDLSDFYHWKLAADGNTTRITIEFFGSRKTLHPSGRDAGRTGDPMNPESYHHQDNHWRESWVANLNSLEKLALSGKLDDRSRKDSETSLRTED